MSTITNVNARLLCLFLIISSLFLASCSKNIDVDPIAVAKSRLVGTAINPITWKLIEIKEEGIIANSNSAANSNPTVNYLIRFYQGGSFLDSDGVVGKWDIPNTESLTKSYVNLISGVEVIQSYIIEQNDGNILKVKYTYQGKIIQLTYASSTR